MDRPARVYLCARCRVQVILCSRCDRGNRYCSRACWRQARDQAQREASRRYQQSRRGRIAHARRCGRWRQRRAAAAGAGEHAQNVTHQGSQPAVGTAPLAAWTHDSASSEAAAGAPDTTVASTPASPEAAAYWTCRRCGARLGLHLRLGFVRHGLPLQRRRHDHGP